MIASDIIGEKFGKLTVLGYEGKIKATKGYKHFYTCMCDCGKEKSIQRHMLLNGKTKSCGCLNMEFIKSSLHKQNRKYKNAKEGDKILTVWRNMKSRCYTSSNKSYKNYGSRGKKFAMIGFIVLTLFMNGRYLMDTRMVYL